MDALELLRETYKEIDPDEEGSDEQGCASSSSPTMEPSQPSQLHSVGHSPPIDAIESIREMYQKIDPLDQIDPLLCFVETWLHRMNNPSEAGSSSSEGWLETVREGTELAAMTIDTISTEAEKLSKSDAVEEMGNLVLKVVKGIEESHLVFIGLSIAAFALESYMRVRSVDNECRELLLKILELAQNVKQYREQMHGTGKLCSAVGTIVECGVICCDYLTRGGTFRFWSTTTAAAQLEKANQQLRDIRDSIQFIKDYRGDKDVFLSHSGKQKNFVRQLHRDLTREHVSCFFDEDGKSLPLAQKFPPLILKHAETCKIAVLVLSKDFIFSKWPMLELSAFIRAKNSGKNVNLRLFPIFFMISPKELRITKDNAEWQKLEVSNEDRGEWEAALKEVRSTNGLHFGEDGNEVDCREKVVKEICCILERINLESRPQLLDFEPVGIDKARKEVTKLLALTEPSRRVVVIYGVGGIGKTTLATAVFKSLDLRGHHYCRVDMDQDCKLSDLRAKQKQILRDLFKENSKLSDYNHGLGKLGEAFGKALKPVFLFIDNALRQTDLQKLLPINHILGLPMRSRILITTRNLKETNVYGLQHGIQFCSHRIDSVSEPEAKRILCHYAVDDMNGHFDRGVDIGGLLRICGGIPLILRIVGSHLRTKILGGERNAVSAYNDTLQYFKEWQQEGFEGGEEDVSESIVGFVYERLKEPCKQALLDIAFFFNDWDRSKVADIVGKDNLHDLEVAALVTTSEEKDEWERTGKTVVKMHDIVRARGKKLAKGTRITDIESLSVLLSDAQKLEQIKGVGLSGDDVMSLQVKHVDLMSNSLRVLSLGKRIKVNGRCERAFEQLRFLHISYEDMLPLDLCKASRLIYLEGHFSKGSHMMAEAKFTLHLPESLRVLHLYGEYHNPASLDIIGHLTSVRELKLSHITLHGFGNMSCLQSLDMSSCSQLQGLPKSFGNMSCLQTLDMSHCRKLHGLPENVGNMSCLQTLDMRKCSQLQGLPESFGNMSCLKTLDMRECSRLQGLPQSFGNLSCLQTLDMSHCRKLQGLPESFGNMSCLQTLDMSYCSELQGLSESFGNMSCLQTLAMTSCSKLQVLPESFGNMSCLHTLDMSYFSELQGLPQSFGNMSCLQTLAMTSCSKLRRLPEGFGNLSYLQTLDMSHCRKLQGLPESFGNMSCLQTLDMSYCSELQGLPESFGNISCLQTLHMSSCSQLQGLPKSFGNMSCLQTLDMRECSKLQGLPESFGNMSCLQTLNMSYCWELQGLTQTFDQLSCLQTLEIDGCERMCSFSVSFGKLKGLKFLNISNCKELNRLPEDIVCSTSLAAIKAKRCASLEAKAMDSLVEITSLKFLDIDDSPMLIKRWEEIIQQHPPAIGLPLRLTRVRFRYEPDEGTVSAMFFSGGSTFPHVDGESMSSFPDVGVKVCLFFTEAWDILSDDVKQKVAEVASQEFQIMYVDVGMEGEAKEEREKRVREVLEQLPEGSRAWTSPFYKTRLLFAYSLWRSTRGVNTSIWSTNVLVDGEGRRKLSQPFEKIFQEDRSVRLTDLFSPLSKAWDWIG